MTVTNLTNERKLKLIETELKAIDKKRDAMAREARRLKALIQLAEAKAKMDVKAVKAATFEVKETATGVSNVLLLKNPKCWVKGTSTQTLMSTSQGRKQRVAVASSSPAFGHLSGQVFKGKVVSWMPAWAAKLGVALA